MTCWQEGTRCRRAVGRAGMLASATAVGLTRMASSAGYVGSRRAGLQFELVSSRTVRDTIRPTLPSSGASTVGRLKSRQVRLWTATAVAGQPAPSASHPSASRSCAALERSDQVHGDTRSERGVNEYRTAVHSVHVPRSASGQPTLRAHRLHAPAPVLSSSLKTCANLQRRAPTPPPRPSPPY